MKIFVTCLCLTVFMLALVGCSDDKNIIDSIGPVEDGSQSMIVNADVSGSDAGGGTFVTSYTVTVLDSLSAPITNAVVTISHATVGTVNFVYDTLTASTYRASTSGYSPGAYTLTVTSGAQFIFNATVVGPDIHAITFPAVTDTIAVNTAFTTTWTRTTVAELVEVETRDYGPALSTDVGDTDDGTFLVPASVTLRDDQRVRITRSNSKVLTSGFIGSDFKVSIRNSVEPFVVN